MSDLELKKSVTVARPQRLFTVFRYPLDQMTIIILPKPKPMSTVSADFVLNRESVGMLTVMGLSSKNAILIVEFAKNMHEKEGKPLFEAALVDHPLVRVIHVKEQESIGKMLYK